MTVTMLEQQTDQEIATTVLLETTQKTEESISRPIDCSSMYN